MNNDTRKAIERAAVARARELCAAALETLSRGRAVRGRRTREPWSPVKRAELKRLQEDFFRHGPAVGLDHIILGLCLPFYASEFVHEERDEQAFLAEARAAYTSVGLAEVARLFAE